MKRCFLVYKSRLRVNVNLQKSQLTWNVIFQQFILCWNLLYIKWWVIWLYSNRKHTAVCFFCDSNLDRQRAVSCLLLWYLEDYKQHLTPLLPPTVQKWCRMQHRSDELPSCWLFCFRSHRLKDTWTWGTKYSNESKGNKLHENFNGKALNVFWTWFLQRLKLTKAHQVLIYLSQSAWSII